MDPHCLDPHYSLGPICTRYIQNMKGVPRSTLGVSNNISRWISFGGLEVILEIYVIDF